MKVSLFVLLLVLSISAAVFFLGNAEGWTADYSVSTSTAAREEALTYEAKRTNNTNAFVLQELIDQYLDDRTKRLEEARRERLYRGYQKASPSNKALIEGIFGPLP